MLSEALPMIGALEQDDETVRPAVRRQRADRIVVADIHRTFHTDEGPLPVVGGISFSVAEGETVAIVGPSGCGKSTLVNILASLDRPDRGSVKIDGKERLGASRKAIVISQQGSVFPWMTVRDNVAFGLKQGRREERLAVADSFIEMVGLKGFENRHPHELSGGMLKRVELARAFAVKPDVLFMDEPFSALDALMSLKMRTELARSLELQGQTLVLITHDVEEAIHLADRILVLSPRPTRIKTTFEVPLPRPRKLTSPAAQSLKEKVLAELGL
jgi:ABC-type nitrate/sulfonate/bicarbonate transport system ATPase subunit